MENIDEPYKMPQKSNALFLICAMTIFPFLCAWVLTFDYFSISLSQKQHGTFLERTQFLPLMTDLPFDQSTSSNSSLSQPLSHKLPSNNDVMINKNVWHIVANENNKAVLEKLHKIKTALGKKSNLVDIITTNNLPAAAYIATPEGQLLLRYQHSDIGKPFYHDLKHLLRSNTR